MMFRLDSISSLIHDTQATAQSLSAATQANKRQRTPEVHTVVVQGCVAVVDQLGEASDGLRRS